MIRKTACRSCPYRRDVPSGVWSPDEYAKLPPYDAPTGEQPFAAFACHATPALACHGWAVVHSARGHAHDLLALRLYAPGEPIPAARVPLFSSGAEAAAHGLRDVECPGEDARAAVALLMDKHARLREGAR